MTADENDKVGVPEEPKDAKEAPEAEAAPKPKRTRAKKPKAEAAAETGGAEAPAAEATADEPEAEAKPKPRRTRAKKTEAAPKEKAPKAEAPKEEAPKEEAPEEEAPEEQAPEEEPVAEEPAPEEEPVAEEPAPPAKPAPARKRDRREPVETGLLVRAQARYVRTSARKARLVCDHIRGKDVAEARAILAFTPRAAATPWLKLLESAVANAEHNHELVGEDLRISAVHADEGPTLKRFRPRAMGRATRIRKRTSHLTITLTPKES